MTAHTLASVHEARRVAPLRRESPTITVVVASNRSWESLDRCIASLRQQCARASAELIVVRACSAAELLELRAAMPGIHFVAAAPSTSVPQLRALGMAESTGDIVAFTEDLWVADDEWIETLLVHAHDEIGGGMT